MHLSPTSKLGYLSFKNFQIVESYVEKKYARATAA